MGEYNVTQGAVSQMKGLASNLGEQAEKIHKEADSLERVFQENQDGLGAHSSEIQTLIEEVKKTEQDASKPVKKLQSKLIRAAGVREEHISTSRYK